MHLNELTAIDAKTIIRKTREPSADRKQQTIEAWLLDKGFKKIGSGKYGSVWSNDDHFVVKIFNDDPCYVSFVKFCQQHRDAHLPRISRLYPTGPDSGVVFLERLQAYTRGVGDVYEDDIRYYLGWCHRREPDEEDNYLERWAEEHPPLAATLDLLAKAFKGTRCWPDIGEENLMQREGTVVIIDPMAPLR